MAAPGMAWTTGLVAFVAAVPLWRYTTHAITIAHEGGHALFGSLAGLLVKKVTVERGGAGGTNFSKPPKDWGIFQTVVAGMAGYLAPSLFGLAGAWMLAHDLSPRAVLLMTLVLMALLLVMVRNLFGFFVVPLTGALIWTVAMRASADVQMVFAHIWVWFLLMGGARQVPELFWAWRSGEYNDTGLLSTKTHLSNELFIALFWLGSMAALICGGVLLLRHKP